VFEKVRLERIDELFACSVGKVSLFFVVFAEGFRGTGPKENSSFMEWCA